jgi:hypothetical protein
MTGNSNASRGTPSWQGILSLNTVIPNTSEELTTNTAVAHPYRSRTQAANRGLDILQTWLAGPSNSRLDRAQGKTLEGIFRYLLEDHYSELEKQIKEVTQAASRLAAQTPQIASLPPSPPAVQSYAEALKVSTKAKNPTEFEVSLSLAKLPVDHRLRKAQPSELKSELQAALGKAEVGPKLPSGSEKAIRAVRPVSNGSILILYMETRRTRECYRHRPTGP